MNVTDKDLKRTIERLAEVFNKKLMECKEEDLEQYWHYKHNPNLTESQRLYNFYDMLNLYSSFCRRWEEAKNGSCCVVERVRDKYIMPKIVEYIKKEKER